MSARRRLSAVARVAFGTAIVLALGVAAVTVVSYVAVSRNLEAEVDRSLLQESNAFAAAVQQDAPTTPAELVDSARVYLQGRLQSGSGSAPRSATPMPITSSVRPRSSRIARAASSESAA